MLFILHVREMEYLKRAMAKMLLLTFPFSFLGRIVGLPKRGITDARRALNNQPGRVAV